MKDTHYVRVEATWRLRNGKEKMVSEVTPDHVLEDQTEYQYAEDHMRRPMNGEELVKVEVKRVRA